MAKKTENVSEDRNEIYQIYDRIFKRLFNLSNVAIINLINGLFGTNHSLESEVTYLNKEFTNEQLQRRIADVVVNINHRHMYHMEAQIVKDNNIVFRVFEYGFYVAMENREDGEILNFPEPVVIYLSKETDIPAQSTITINFGEQGSFKYGVKNFVYLDHNITEINRKKLVVLIPFQLLRLKSLIHKNPTREHFEQLQTLMENDILGSIEANLKVGNITVDDASQLRELTMQLYEHLYKNYYEIGGCQDMKPLLEGAMELPLDKYRIRIDELEADKEKIKTENVQIKTENVQIKAENAQIKTENAQIKDDKAQAEAKIAELEKRIKELEAK